MPVKRNHKIKEIKKYLKLLMMPGFSAALEDALHKTDVFTEDVLLELLKIELTNRESNRVQRLLRQSRLPLDKNVDNFDFKKIPLKINRQFNALQDGSFLDRKENVLVFGKPGSGKTHLLCALGVSLIYSGRRAYFTTTSYLVQELLVAKRELKLETFIKKLEKFEALIIDDIGYVQQTREEMEVLFTLLAHRYERGSVLLTSNLPFSKWEQIFKDPMTTAAAIDRLVHHSIILELNIPSYRLETAKRKNIK